jgi:hypothetical protein
MGPVIQNLEFLKSLSTPSKSVNSSLIPSPASSVRSLSRDPATSTPTQKNISSFAPWDRDQLVARLGTFRDVFWSQLPEELREIEWARRGWVERKDGIKGVECGLCKAQVEVTWNWDKLRERIIAERESSEAEEQEDVPEGSISESGLTMSPTPGPRSESNQGKEEIYSKEAVDDTEATSLLLQHYKPLLSEGHTKKCPWATRSTDLTILRLPPAQLTLPSLTTRLTSLQPILPFLPTSERVLTPQPLPISLPSQLHEYDHRLLQAGITGWSGSLLGNRGILHCSTCHRRVGLWLFTSSSSTSSLHWEEENLDLLKEHKSYCPWINSAVQTGMAGWEYLFALLEPKRETKKRERTEDEDDGSSQSKESRFKRLREMLKGIKK